MAASNSINANPGQVVRFAVTTEDNDGYRVDGYVPYVEKVFLPNLMVLAGYPKLMTRIDRGLYLYGLEIPSDASALGTWVVTVVYYEQGKQRNEVFTLQIARPFGNSSVVPI